MITRPPLTLGIEEESGRYYISILVSNRRIDYDEYYEIDKADFKPAFRGRKRFAMAGD